MSAPSVSLHVGNLPYNVVKKEEMRRSLYSLFSTYGKVLDVVHSREGKQRGIAFIVFKDLSSSTSAMRALDGEGFYGKALKISYALKTSHATIAATEGPEAVYLIKSRLRNVAGEKTSKLTVSGAQKKLIEEGKKRSRENEEEEEEEEEEDEDTREKKKGRQDEGDDDDAMEEESDDEAPAPAPGPAAPEQGSEPNPILFIEGLPAEITSEMLTPLFQQYPGLSSLKLLPTPKGISTPNSATAFVQYESVVHAGTAKENLDGFLLTKGAPMKVGWAKRG